MSKQIRITVSLVLGVFLCLAFASLLLADEAAVPFRITSHDPSAHEVGVGVDANVQATFNYELDPGTVTNDTFVVHGHLGGLASGTFSYHALSFTITLNPDRAFHAGEVLRVSATSGIQNAGAEALEPYGWQFTVSQLPARRFAGFIDTSAALVEVTGGSVAWGDYDNDTDVDIVLTGYGSGGRVSKVYRNDGSGVFSDIGAALTDVYAGSVAWGDYDNDGDLDMLLTGSGTTGRVSKVYRNDGGVFTDAALGLTDVYWASGAWGDYDNDGDLDILLTGLASADNPVSKVYRNDAGSAFTDIGAGLTGVWHASVAWGDVDNDGDLDILLTGATALDPDYIPESKVYRNDGASGFTDTAADLTDVYWGSVAWGDYDNDGDLDILLTGLDSHGHPVSRVYRNDGPSGFTDIGAGLTGVHASSVAWGDYDNDGDLDILLSGSSAIDPDYIPESRVYRNDGGGAFTDIAAGLIAVYGSSVAWGDYDNDNDLDILLTGITDGTTRMSKVYRNNSQPGVDGVVPNAGGAPVASTVSFTTTWSDRDGAADLKHCYFHIGDSPSLAGNVTLLYNAAKNKLWLLDDSGSAWMGGHAPGDSIVLENGQARLYCADTRVRRLGNRLEVTWVIRFRPGFEGAKKLGLKARDIYKSRAKAKWKGTWTIE
jgi:hypothetical protein